MGQQRRSVPESGPMHLPYNGYMIVAKKGLSLKLIQILRAHENFRSQLCRARIVHQLHHAGPDR